MDAGMAPARGLVSFLCMSGSTHARTLEVVLREVEMREACERVKLLRDLAAQTVDRQVQAHERRRGHPENGHELAELKVPRHSLPICEQKRS